MSSKANSQMVIVSVVGGIIIFIVGIAIGMIFPLHLTVKQPTSMSTDSGFAATMKSQIVNSVLLYGTVTKVSGQSIVISRNTASAAISLDAATKFYTINYAQNGTQKPSTLDALKNGQAVEVSVKVNSNNQLLAVAVITLLPK